MGNQVVVGRGGGNRWQAESGQYLLELDVVGGGRFAADHGDKAGWRRECGRCWRSGRGCGAARPGVGLAEVDRADASSDSVDAHAWFERGLAAEESDMVAALEAYERCRALDARHVGARINLGRLLHEAGRLKEAQRVYAEAVRECEPDPTLFFNLGVRVGRCLAQRGGGRGLSAGARGGS